MGDRLGAAFIELDGRARLSDPRGPRRRPFLSGLAQQAGIPCVAVLARLEGDTVARCGQPQRGQPDAGQLRTRSSTSYERCYAKSRSSAVETRQLTNLLTVKGEASPCARLRLELARLAKQGYSISHDVDAGRVALINLGSSAGLSSTASPLSPMVRGPAGHRGASARSPGCVRGLVGKAARWR